MFVLPAAHDATSVTCPNTTKRILCMENCPAALTGQYHVYCKLLFFRKNVVLEEVYHYPGPLQIDDKILLSTANEMHMCKFMAA